MKDRSLFQLLGLLRPTAQRNEKAAANGRAQYIKQVDGYLARGKRPAAVTQSWSFWNQKKLAVAFMTTLMLLVFLVSSGAGVVAAAQGTLPGEALYPVKTFVEDARLALTNNTYSKYDLLGSYVIDRIDEIDALQELGAVIPGNVTYRLGKQLDAMLAIAAVMDDASMTTSLVDMQKMLMAAWMKFGTTGDQDRIRDQYDDNFNNQGEQMVAIKKQNRDYLEITYIALNDPAGFRYMYAYSGINKPVDSGNDLPGTGTGTGSANTDPGNLDAAGPGPGDGAVNSFGPGYLITGTLTETEFLPGTWGPGAAGGLVITDVLTDTSYGPGPDDPLYYYWGDGPYGTPSEDAAQKQLKQHDQ